MSEHREFLIWTIVIPILMLGMSVWQEARALQTQAGEERYRVRLAEDVPILEAILTRNPETIIQFSEDGAEVPVPVAVEAAHKAQRHMALIEKLRWASMGIPVMGGLASLSVIGAALTGLWGIRRVRQFGLRSRQELVQQFSLWQRRLTGVLCVLAGGFCCAVVCVVGFEIWHYVITHMHAKLDVGALVRAGLMLVPIIITGVYVPYKIVKAWREIFVHNSMCLVGIKATAEKYPAVWDFVRDIARRVGAQPPDAVVLGVNAEFFVTASDVDLVLTQESCSGNTLYLGLPYLVYLSRDELTSIVAHELGHYVGEDLEYSKRFLPLYVRAWEQLDLLTGGEDDLLCTSRVALEPARMLAVFFLQSLQVSVHFWSRQRELAADGVSVAVCGAHTAAVALLRVVALQDRLNEALRLWRESPDLEPSGEDLPDTENTEDMEENAPVTIAANATCRDATNDSADALLGEDTEECADDPAPQTLEQAFNAPEGLLIFIRRVVQEQGIPDPRETLEEAVPHLLDTHPLTGQRLEVWGAVPDDALVAQAVRQEESDVLRAWGVTAQEGEATPKDALM